MVIGLDIDGAINRHPQFFAFMSQTLMQAGYEVVVITFREDRASATDDLAAWGIRYGQLVTWSFQADGGEDMYAGKDRRCHTLRVDILFDDDPLVLCRLPPAILGMMPVDHQIHDWAGLGDGRDGPDKRCSSRTDCQ